MSRRVCLAKDLLSRAVERGTGIQALCGLEGCDSLKRERHAGGWKKTIGEVCPSLTFLFG